MTQEVTGGPVLGILGGTGDQGRGLARRFLLAGRRVILGSRDAERAQSVATSLGYDLDEGARERLRGAGNGTCARDAELVIVAVPYDGHAALLESVRAELAGKIVVDCVNPIGFDARGAYPLAVPEGSACQQAQLLLPESRVVGAFHHVSAVLLLDPNVLTLDTDVLVLGDDREATDRVQALADELPGVRGRYAGRLRNAGQIEALTANLISVNRRYKAHAGVRLTDVHDLPGSARA